MDNESLFNEYMDVVSRERSMRREVVRSVYDDPISAFKCGLIDITFKFPTPHPTFRSDIRNIIIEKIRR